MNIALLWILTAGAAGLAADAPEVTLRLRDYVGHHWTDELVHYTLRLPEGLRPDEVTLKDEQGQLLPVQVQPAADGQVTVSFIVPELRPDEERTFTLQPGGGPGGAGLRARPPLAVRTEGNALVLDSGRIAVRVPRGGRRLAEPAGLDAVPAPFLAVRGRSGAWFGRGWLAGPLRVRAWRSELVARGPAFAEVRIRYTFDDLGRNGTASVPYHSHPSSLIPHPSSLAGRNGTASVPYYTASVRVIAGQDMVLVREEFDTGPPGREYNSLPTGPFFNFSLWPGLKPDRACIRYSDAARLWREREDRRTLPLGEDYRLTFDQARRELSVLGYVPWWPETCRGVSLYHSQGEDLVSFFPVRIGRWRNPTGLYVMTEPPSSLIPHPASQSLIPHPDLYLSLPLNVHQEWTRDGVERDSPYYTGHLEDTWPRTAGRREWALVCSTVEEALAAGELGDNPLQQQFIKYSDLPLDKVKDWVLDWEDPEPVEYPRLFVEPDRLEEVRERFLACPRWAGQLGRHYKREQTYLITGDETVGRQLIDDEAGGDLNWQGELLRLRQYCDLLFNVGLLGPGTAAPNNARPMWDLVRFDTAMAVQSATDEERTEMRRRMAFIANMLFDQDWNPTQAGFHLGNPNMPPRQEHHLAVAACVLPTHPDAPKWAARGLAEPLRQLATMVSPGGSWRECPHYEMDAAMYPLFQAAVALKFSGYHDLFADERLKSTFDYLLGLTTPPDPRFGVRVLPAFGNGSWEMNPLFGWFAALTREADPKFSARMQWAWIEHGRPDYYTPSELLIDPDLPAQQPDLRSTAYPGFGVVMRSGFPSPKETMLLYRQGKDHEHYNFGDQGSFMIYAQGAPLVLHFGSVYQPQFRGAWYFNRPCLGHATEVEDTTGTVTAFATLPTADFVRGEHRCTKQGLCPDDAREPLPPNTPLPERALPPTLWTRRILFLKDADVDGPNYFVIRDDYSEQPTLPSEWNLWCLATEVVTNGVGNGRRAVPDGRRAVPNGSSLIPHPSSLITFKGQYDVDLDVFMADPAQPEWTTRQDRHEFLAGPSMEYWRAVNGDKPWQETMWNVRTTQPVGQGYLAVLYPRRAEEAGADYAALADGAGVRVATPRGTDFAFLSLKPVQWSGEGTSFSGTAGAIRRADAGTTLLLAEAGVVSSGDVALQATGPASAAVQGQHVLLCTHGPAQTLRLTLPADATARATHNGQALALKRDGPTWLIPVVDGEQEVKVTW